ncbi:MAG: PQQ-binding-like beta-propeller repeat protein [Gemmataceae bacterium]|nr:PQQ-binding-like beta-propeller repeat protein [Gemmataceae bacterium]MCI0740739.1 PQQ-binding-like beta-propeller repeat protein [Gemmataceae bacterium]
MNRLAFVGLLLSTVPLAHADWPGFRGVSGGLASDKGLPVEWGAEKNVVWKIKLPGPGSSSPIVWKDRVYVTCYSGYGLKKGDKSDIANLRRHLLAVECKTGKIVWDRPAPPLLPETEYTGNITEHGYASSTPVTDGERIFVFHGRSGVFAFDKQGKQLWHKEVGSGLNSWGSAASPILAGNKLIVNAGVEGDSLIAFDKISGDEVWRAKGIGHCWSTPVLVELPGGKQEIVLSVQSALYGFDLATGEKLWECEGPSTATASSTPVTRDGVVFAIGAGFEGRSSIAVKAGGRGDVTKTHVLWRQKIGANHCSPVLVDGRLHWVSGRAICLDAKTGAIIQEKDLYGARQEYVSAVAADGKIIAFTRRDGAFVLDANRGFEKIAHNDLGDNSTFNSCPAISDGNLFVRSNAFLYCLGQKP